MAKLNVELKVLGNGKHLRQIFTGFAILEKQGVIRVSQSFTKYDPRSYNMQPLHLQDSMKYHLLIKVNDKLSVFYDLHDSYEIIADNVDKVDIYFKRSYNKKYVSENGWDSKVYPLGLNYEVYPDFIDIRSILRAVRCDLESRKKMIWGIASALKCERMLGIKQVSLMRHNAFYSLPSLESNPKVLFLVRLWDPRGCIDEQKVQEREDINNVRIEIVKSLKKELGERFLGGILKEPFSRNECPEQLLAEDKITDKCNYLKVMREYPIAVATTGLHGSIGWKLAEYVAHAKAIVSEPLNYQVPGEFCEDKNYLLFDTSEKCVENVMKLVENNSLRKNMMIDNFLYYIKNLAPEMLVLNSLCVVMKHL